MVLWQKHVPRLYATGYSSWADAQEAEGFGLKERGASEDIGGDGPLRHGLNSVAGQGGEIADQRLEAVGGKALWGTPAAGLSACGGRGSGGLDG